jgi:hypothetical protein
VERTCAIVLAQRIHLQRGNVTKCGVLKILNLLGVLFLQIYKGASIASGQQQAVVAGIGRFGVHARDGKSQCSSSTF